MIIKDWSENDRPREKLFLKGRMVLSEAEPTNFGEEN